jgi:MFS family permease
MKQQVASLAQILQVGTFFGGICLGTVTDRLGKRTLVLAPLLLLSALCIWHMSTLDPQVIRPFYVLFFLFGFAFGGPYGQLGGTISMDLSELP